jgi:hypothetical protein
MSAPGNYFKGSQHPWPCFLLVLPLLVLYEVAVLRLGGTQPNALRNGVDYWMRQGLQKIGLKWFWVLPAVLLFCLAVWVIRRRKDRPGDLVGVLSGMGIESVAFALGLWALSRLLAPLMHTLGSQLLTVIIDPDRSLKRLVPFLGAGVYEETVFRLLLFSMVFALMRRLEVHVGLAIFLAALGSATLFAAAHHAGPYGEKYNPFDFLFRLLAGLYFALLYHYRGFGIAVVTHSCYNVMVSLGTP